MDISIPYYEDLSRISNSNIGWFLQKGPAYLHKMLTDPPPEEKNPVLERGSLIHMYLLQPEEFLKTYVVWDKSRPTSAQQEKFCQALANTVEIEPNKAILSAYKEAYSTAGRSEDKMLSEGLKIASTLKDYINYLKDPERKQMISPYEYQMLKKIRNNIEAHKLAKPLLWPVEQMKNYSGDGWEDVMNECKYNHEFHINWECRGVKCKSLLDGLILDFKNKKAIIYDLKTTQKLWHFEDSIDMYDYCRQLAYYSMAVDWYLEEECKEEPLDWTYEYYIIGIDTTGSYEIRVFKVEPHMIQSRMDTIYDALDEIAWHQSTGKWDHSREYYNGDGSETLNL
jgi:hypothetical protein